MNKPLEKTNVTKFKNSLSEEEFEYDICVSDSFLVATMTLPRIIYQEYVYLGVGYISMVDGEPYNGKVLCHFWKYK